MSIPTSIDDLKRDIIFLSAYADQIIDKPAINEFDFRRIIIASLFAKIITGAQSIQVLCDNNYSVEAAVIARSLLDTLFFLGVCRKDDYSFERYIERDLYELKKLVNLCNLKTHIYSNEMRRTVETIYNNVLSQQLRESKPQLKRIEEAAQISGLEIMYEYPYRELSAAVHSSPVFILETYVRHDENSITGINVGPYPRSAKETYVPTNIVLLQSSKWYLLDFGLEEDKRFSSLFEEYARP